MVLISLLEQRLQDCGDRAGLAAARVAQNGDVATEEIVETDFDVVVFEHDRPPNGQYSVPRRAGRLAGTAIQPHRRFDSALSLEYSVELVIQSV
ncbi:hypothetical protein D3C85_1459430 [compost metagenome]